MASVPERHSRQGRGEINMAALDDNSQDYLNSGDYSPTYDVLSDVKVNSGVNGEKVQARSGFYVSRWFIFRIAVLLFTALVGALIGVAVYHVITSKTNNEDQGKSVHDNQIRSSGHGSTYIRWGKSSCPSNGTGTELVYAGYAGGGYYTHAGAASSYLCLPDEPQWGRYEDKLQAGGLVYGAQYEMTERKWFPNAALNNDVPCAVCRSPRASILMIPARKGCYGNWTIEYHGYLMSGRYNHVAATDYVCVDEHPESVVGGSVEQHGKLFYLVEGRCGPLPCPPYVNGRELTCVVCSK